METRKCYNQKIYKTLARSFPVFGFPDGKLHTVGIHTLQRKLIKQEKHIHAFFNHNFNSLLSLPPKICIKYFSTMAIFSFGM